MAANSPVLTVPDARAWHSWLTEHHGDASGVWLVLAKKGTTEPTSLTYDQALQEALCFGWVDGQLGPGDEATFRRRFTPRRLGSSWSKRNVALVELLARQERMLPSGRAAVERAKADGSWGSAYSSHAARPARQPLVPPSEEPNSVATGAAPRPRGSDEPVVNARRAEPRSSPRARACAGRTPYGLHSFWSRPDRN
jgi:hypothetical protein